MARSILITGGTGFFGKGFVTHLLKQSDFDRICIYSRGEHSQAIMREELLDDPRLRWFIGDVRDRDRLTRACRGVDTLVHAAALKRVEVGVYNPEEMVRTNIDGAMNVISACMDANINQAVLVSTDKAVEPINTYGKTKAVAEDLFINANEVAGRFGTKFAAARYGNVWCSTGSVVPKWYEALKRGSTRLKVTDPDCTRFFMHRQEASLLILNLVQHMSRGEIRTPDLPAYRLGDLAEAFGAEMDVIGLPDWEKKHESMVIGETSETARRMSVDELRVELARAGYLNEV